MTQIEKSCSAELDQYYTNPEYAKYFFSKVSDTVEMSKFDVQLEPSAGTGAFYSLMDKDKRFGLDLDPKHPGVIQHDYLSWFPDIGKTTIVIGNPPFGKNSNLAIKFFNHSVFADVIAMVLPRTFRKASVINRLDPYFHLICDDLVPDNSFIFDSKPYNVWCCAQIWEKRSYKREKIKIYNLKDVSDFFEIVEPEFSDFCIRRVGGSAGKIFEVDFKRFSPMSNYFIKSKHTQTLKILKNIDFNDVKHNTAGNPSVSPSELVELFLEEAVIQGLPVNSIQFGNGLFI